MTPEQKQQRIEQIREHLAQRKAETRPLPSTEIYIAHVDFLLSLVNSQEAGRQSRISDLDEYGFRIADYSEDEQAVCDYLRSRTANVGCGNDPIGFLIASHSWTVHERNEAAAAMRSACVEKVKAMIEDWGNPDSDLDDEVSGFRIDAANDIVTALESLSIQEQEK